MSGFLDLAIRVANSPAGLTFIGGMFTIILGIIFKKSPAWQITFERYRPAFFDAVRAAETAIPDNTPNVAMQRMDFALKMLLKLEPELAKKPDATLIRGLTEAHEIRNS